MENEAKETGKLKYSTSLLILHVLIIIGSLVFVNAAGLVLIMMEEFLKFLYAMIWLFYFISIGAFYFEVQSIKKKDLELPESYQAISIVYLMIMVAYLMGIFIIRDVSNFKWQ